MSKTNIAVGIGSFVVVLLAAGGFLLWRGHYSVKLARSSTGPDYSVGRASLSGDSSAAQSGTANSSGGLSVGGSATGGSLGQLGASSGSGGQSGASGGSSSGSSEPSPDTFAQYDKYKTSQNALFGDIKVGTGDELVANKKAAVYYKGWLTNGQMFDQSRAGSDGKLQPFNFTLGAHEVIPGWEQGVAGMKVGGTRLIIVPPAVGYGEKGQGPIPGGAVLVFEVQLLAIQ